MSKKNRKTNKNKNFTRKSNNKKAGKSMTNQINNILKTTTNTSTGKSWKETLEEKQKREEELYKKMFPCKSDDTPQNEYFNKIVRMSQFQLKAFCEIELHKRGYDCIKEKDGFLYAKGELPILLVAHMDTVHEKCVQEIYYNNGKVYSPQGIGGDDRCGIYMILEIVKEFKCHVLFTEDEEIGCIGANKFTKTTQYKNMDINYIVEFDRRGKNDAVFYDCENPEFTKFITEDGNGFFEESYGSCSDISYVAPYLGIAAVNLSCGYHEAHTKKEYVVLEEMEAVIVETKKILAKEVEKPFEYIEATNWYKTKSYSNIWNGYNKTDYYDDYYDYGYDYDYGYGHNKKRSNKIELGAIENDEDEYGNVYLLQERDCEEENIYHISFCDKKTERVKVAEILAVTEYEAIGMFLDVYSDYTSNDILSIDSF